MVNKILKVFEGFLSDVECIKDESNYLCGILGEIMLDCISLGIFEDDNCLMKFYGSYL